MGKLESVEETITKTEKELENLEDTYHRQTQEVIRNFDDLELKKSEIEEALQEIYEATSYILRQDDNASDCDFMSLNQTIDSFQTDLDWEYSKEHHRLSDLEEESRQIYLTKRNQFEQKIDDLYRQKNQIKS